MVIHEELWSNMKNMGFPEHIILLLRAMYNKQKAAVRTTYGLTDWFEIDQGVCQGCILSPHLFSLYSENIMRNALEGHIGDITIGGRTITNLRYADDIVLIANSFPKLQELVDRVRAESEKAGLFLNAKKTKVMKVLRQAAEGEEHQNIWINGEKIENAKRFTYLGADLTNSYDDIPEIKRRIAIAKNAVVSLTKIWKDKGISLITKRDCYLL